MRKKYFKQHLKFIIPIIVLSIATIALAVWGVTTKTLAITYSNHLENQYEKSFYQAVDGMDEVEASLSKVIVSLDSDARQNMLSEIYVACTSVQGDLASLPIEHSSIESTVNFVNTLGGYCYAMKNKLYYGQNLSTEENAQLEEFYATSQQLKTELNNLALKVLGDYRIIDNIDINNKDISYFSEEWVSSSQLTNSVPSLIYDGPFSDAVVNKQIVGLPETEVTKEVAKEIISGTIGKVLLISDIKYENETKSRFETYNFTVTVENNKKYNVQICKRGGFILSIDETEPTKANSDYGKSNSEIMLIAKEFCFNIGFDTVVPVYVTDMGNYAFINLVPKIEDCYIYPDMVKVKIEKTSGSVCGFDAVSYAYNHQERINLSATLGATQALEKVNSSMEIFSTKLCVIPLEFGGEVLCYEFYGAMQGNEYYVYINANNGKQENILRVVSTSEGDLTV